MYILTLKHTFGSNLGLAKHNPDKNFKLYPKAINWGNVLLRRVIQTRSKYVSGSVPVSTVSSRIIYTHLSSCWRWQPTKTPAISVRRRHC